MDFHPESKNLITRFTLADDRYSSILEVARLLFDHLEKRN